MELMGKNYLLLEISKKYIWSLFMLFWSLIYLQLVMNQKNLVILSALIVCCLSLRSYNSTLGLDLCRLTVASYCGPTKVKNWSCKPCMDSPIKLANVMPFYNSTGDVLGLIGTSTAPKSIFLVFRGTVPWDIKNWIQDIDFIKMNFPTCSNGCQVHRGFYRAYLEIQSQVTKSVKDYKTKFGISSIIIAGHSLGGALATHAAISLINQGDDIQQFYTFGSPRVGDNKFSTWFDSYIKTNNRVRVTHGRDPVPHLPPSDWGFTHVSHEIFYRAFVRQGFVTCNDSGTKEDPNCSDKYKADVLVTDHLSYYDIDFAGIILTCQ